MWGCLFCFGLVFLFVLACFFFFAPPRPPRRAKRARMGHVVVSLFFWFCVFICFGLFFLFLRRPGLRVVRSARSARASQNAGALAAFRGKETKETPPCRFCAGARGMVVRNNYWPACEKNYERASSHPPKLEKLARKVGGEVANF